MGRFSATPYAKAFYEVVRSQAPERVEAVLDELEGMAAALDQVPELNRVLVAPTLTPESKTAIVDEVLDVLGITDPSGRLLHVLQRHYRIARLPEVIRAYRDLVDRVQGRVRAHIEVASPLDEQQRADVLDALSKLTGATVTAEFETREDLLAGFRATMGSKVFDGSLLGQLDLLRRHSLFE